MLGTILLIVVILMLLGTLPTWPHSKEWGYYPSGGLGLILLADPDHPAALRPDIRRMRTGP